MCPTEIPNEPTATSSTMPTSLRAEGSRKGSVSTSGRNTPAMKAYSTGGNTTRRGNAVLTAITISTAIGACSVSPSHGSAAYLCASPHAMTDAAIAPLSTVTRNALWRSR
jgi:hypothetical protein